MSTIQLPVPHIQQPNDGECLAACAAMLLLYLNIPVDYPKLLKLLKVRPNIGTPAYNIKRLEQLGLTILYQQGSLPDLQQYLSKNRPCIAFVKTVELPYWPEATDHAVVVTGIDPQFVYLNDPAFTTFPLQVPIGDFDLAWLERDEYYATFQSNRYL
ncbi:C39 family peptidase [Anaerolineales bacterium HSG24]|nr:C39 family peptidase [Anaerolineales bacterium HSG24]